MLLDVHIVVWDIGLRSEEAEYIRDMIDKGEVQEFRMFPWASYPPFFSLKTSAGHYAWFLSPILLFAILLSCYRKPIIIDTIASERGGYILWSDAGNSFSSDTLEDIATQVSLLGFWSGRVYGPTHPISWAYLENYTHTKIHTDHQCNAACVAFDTSVYHTKKIIEQWKECALHRDCIAPHGSDRSNHRQDQSVLTFLAAKEGVPCEWFGVRGYSRHMDFICKGRIISFSLISLYL
jgi:hypothetical protein